MTHDRRVERDYILGTADQETNRLGLQHRAWEPFVRECWDRAGVKEGDRVVDVGSGPGYAALDLAGVVGPAGSVTAVERSTRFVEAGREMARGRGFENVSFVEADLMTAPLPGEDYDAAWCRWVGSFVDSSEVLVGRISDSLRTGGVAMFHEYVNYGSWRYSPSLPAVERFIEVVMASWREAGGEPDIAFRLPPVLERNGLRVEHVEPRVFCARPGDPMWSWIATFVESNVGRLVELGRLASEDAAEVRAELHRAEADPMSILLTPTVLEIIARKGESGSPDGVCAGERDTNR